MHIASDTMKKERCQEWQLDFIINQMDENMDGKIAFKEFYENFRVMIYEIKNNQTVQENTKGNRQKKQDPAKGQSFNKSSNNNTYCYSTYLMDVSPRLENEFVDGLSETAKMYMRKRNLSNMDETDLGKVAFSLDKLGLNTKESAKILLKIPQLLNENFKQTQASQELLKEGIKSTRGLTITEVTKVQPGKSQFIKSTQNKDFNNNLNSNTKKPTALKKIYSKDKSEKSPRFRNSCSTINSTNSNKKDNDFIKENTEDMHSKDLSPSSMNNQNMPRIDSKKNLNFKRSSGSFKIIGTNNKNIQKNHTEAYIDLPRMYNKKCEDGQNDFIKNLDFPATKNADMSYDESPKNMVHNDVSSDKSFRFKNESQNNFYNTRKEQKEENLFLGQNLTKSFHRFNDKRYNETSMPPERSVDKRFKENFGLINKKHRINSSYKEGSCIDNLCKESNTFIKAEKNIFKLIKKYMQLQENDFNGKMKFFDDMSKKEFDKISKCITEISNYYNGILGVLYYFISNIKNFIEYKINYFINNESLASENSHIDIHFYSRILDYILLKNQKNNNPNLLNKSDFISQHNTMDTSRKKCALSIQNAVRNSQSMKLFLKQKNVRNFVKKKENYVKQTYKPYKNYYEDSKATKTFDYHPSQIVELIEKNTRQKNALNKTKFCETSRDMRGMKNYFHLNKSHSNMVNKQKNYRDNATDWNVSTEMHGLTNFSLPKSLKPINLSDKKLIATAKESNSMINKHLKSDISEKKVQNSD